jgi:DNA-binding transcriptional LysR family regulator
MGAELYERSTKGFELTAAGRRILRHAERIVALEAEMERIVTRDQEVQGPIRMGVIEMVTLSWLPNFLERIRSSAPAAILEITTGTTAQLVHELKEGRVDIAFVLGPIDEPNFQNQPICALGMYWLANPKYFDCTRSIDVLELARLPIMMQAKSSSGYALVREYFARYGVVDVPSRGANIRLDCVYSAATAFQVVRAGLGVMGLPIFLFDREIRDGQVAVLDVRQQLTTAHVTACYRQPVLISLIEILAVIASEAATDFAKQCDPTHFWT